MFFIKEAIRTFLWLMKVFKAFLKVQPLLTSSIILIETLSKAMHIVAFLLPIKIILLVGSDGIPKYFRSFMNPEDKVAWAGGLVLVSIILYILTLILDAVASNLSDLGSKRTVSAANELVVFARQEEKAKAYYEKTINIFSALFFILAATITLLFINTNIVLSFYALSIIFFFSTSLILSAGQNGQLNYNPQTKFAKWIVKNRGEYVGILTTIVFLSCFIVTLVPYFLGETPSVTLTLISFIIIRQVTSRAKEAVNKTVQVSKNKTDINALIFENHKKQNRVQKNLINILELFDEKNRTKLLSEHLDTFSQEEIFSSWQDSSTSNIRIFEGMAMKVNTKLYFQLYVYEQASSHLFEREKFLFNHIERELLCAPKVLGTFKHEDYQCQIIDSGIGQEPSEQEWEIIEVHWKTYFACIRPSVGLISAFKKSEKLLHQRLTEELISPVELAAKNNEEKKHIQLFRLKLSAVKKKISQMPLYIHNEKINYLNIRWKNEEKDKIMVMNWRNWTLAPIGASWQASGFEEETALSTYLNDILKVRKDVQNKNIKTEDILLMSYSWALEHAIMNEKYREALLIVQKINKLPTVERV